MVDLRQPHPAPDSRRHRSADTDNSPHDGGNGAGARDKRVGPVVVDADRGDIPVLVSDQDTVLLDPWLLTENDIQWLIFLGKKRYGSDWDEATTEGWFRNIVLKSPLMFHAVRTANAFAVSMISTLPWFPSQFECNIVFVCADEGHMWEAFKLMRDSVTWARKRKCSRWRLVSDTEVDLYQMARRLGAKEISPRFTLEL